MGITIILAALSGPAAFNPLDLRPLWILPVPGGTPGVPPEKKAYVLQHEQIHFALMELAARRLNRRVRKDISSFSVIDSSRQGVEEQLKEKISALVKGENKKILQTHTSFDEDCSLSFDPRKQQWWFDRVNKELGARKK